MQDFRIKYRASSLSNFLPGLYTKRGTSRPSYRQRILKIYFPSSRCAGSHEITVSRDDSFEIWPRFLLQASPNLTYLASNKAGDMSTSASASGVSAVSWGVFPGEREMIKIGPSDPLIQPPSD